MSDAVKIRGAEELLETLKKIAELQETLVLPGHNGSEVLLLETNEVRSYNQHLEYARKAVAKMIRLCERSISSN